MIKPHIPINEEKRLEALQEYNILDTMPEKVFDDITKIASHICGTPISLISLIDSERQWFKSHHGLNATETPRDVAFCAHAINQPEEVFVVPDSRKDERFADNPLVTKQPNVVFYAGIPLVNSEGYALGTLCVIDQKPNSLTEEQLATMQALANEVISLFELRKANFELNRMRKELERRNDELSLFSSQVSHDIKSPLATIISFSEIIQSDYSDGLNPDAKEFLGYISESAYKLKDFVEGMLAYYKGESLKNYKLTELDFEELISEISDMVSDSDIDLNITIGGNTKTIVVNKIALAQILLNLITNAIKYNNNDSVIIDIILSEDSRKYYFTVKDNGIGIPDDKLQTIFTLFETLGKKDRYGKTGTGIGLATVKKIIESYGGTIQVNSVPNEGTTFQFSIDK